MKKILMFAMTALFMLSCNAQEPKTNDPEAEKFATEHNMDNATKAKFYEIVNKINEVNAPIEKLAKEYHASKDEARQKQIIAEVDSLSAIVDPMVKQAMKENRDNVIPAFFAQMLMYDMNLDELKELCAEGTGYYNCKEMDGPKQLLAGLMKRAPGTKYKDIEENDLQGKPHKLSEWVGKGNYVLIDFWASWCGPCRAEMPNVKAAYEKYHSKGFEIVGLSFDSKQEAWQKAVNDLGLTWIHLSDLQGWKTLASSTYGVMSIPASILVDPNGVIVAEGLRGDALGKKLAEIYGE